MTLQAALDVLAHERAPAYRARQLTHAIKRSRTVSLVPYVAID